MGKIRVGRVLAAGSLGAAVGAAMAIVSADRAGLIRPAQAQPEAARLARLTAEH